ncbi:DHA2 family efflux MFS transporter permease subunit [Bradyrhizobium sp.]|uniref:DHA2 family efflux MFS transporter permease subunit n=1 Tax=Bradyrhizobium sp. TaxID=376 RepID=UPI0027168D60|nr:DHA2 family efflux MFS transporter permease subunit [Bradyrhizobium sp.]MDO9297182.1 DHA2 family efflux MFS transporter permease subunit [Bradyrhizobium sp.]
MTKERLIPLIVATALFMENMDSTVIATSLPAIAADIGTSPLTLKLAITSYLLSLAVFIPASGWTADRFGARMVFSAAIAVFMVGSIGCALSTSVTHFVIARILQGIGGAMMTPVGRLVLLRSIDKSQLVNAMAWVTVPALIGPVIGPPLGGFITTYFSWHWIFLINIPIGLLGILMAQRYIDPIRSDNPERFDLYGLVLAGTGLGGIAFGLSVAGLNLLPWTVVAALVGIGTVSMTLYVIHARRTQSPVLDFSLMRLPTLRASILGGFLFRLGIGALPFLLPLLMQVGFGLSPFHSGLVTFASAVGAMGMKTLAARIIRTFGFRNLMTINAVISSVFLAACALFTVTTPLLLIMIILVVGGFFRSLQFTAINTVAYAEVEPAQMSRATTLVSVNQQLAISAGVAIGAFTVESTMLMRHVTELGAADFAPAFIVVAIISAISAYFFWQMPDDAGHEISGHSAVEISSRKGAAKAAAKAASETTEDARDQRLG